MDRCRQGRRCHLNVAYEWYSPWFVSAATPNGEIPGGPMGLVLQDLSSVLNFSYSLRRSPDGEWGQPMGGSNWSGMLGMLLSKEADLALGPFTETATRFDVFVLTVPLAFEEYGTLLWPVKETPDIESVSYFHLYPATVWIFLLTCWATASAVSAAREAVTFDPENLLERWWRPGAKYLWHYFASLCRQSSSVLNDAPHSLRSLVISWCFVALVLTSTVGGYFISSLITKVNQHPVTILEDLLRWPSVQLVISKGSMYQSWLQDHTRQGVRELYRRAMKKPDSTLVPFEEFSDPQMFHMVVSGRAAVFTDIYTLVGMVEQNRQTSGKLYHQQQCPRVHMAKESNALGPLVMAFAPYTPRRLRETIDRRYSSSNQSMAHHTCIMWWCSLLPLMIFSANLYLCYVKRRPTYSESFFLK